MFCKKNILIQKKSVVVIFSGLFYLVNQFVTPQIYLVTLLGVLTPSLETLPLEKVGTTSKKLGTKRQKVQAA